MAKQRKPKMARWKGLPLWRAMKYVLFEKIKANQGFSRYDMSGDSTVSEALDKAFALGKKYGRMGMKMKHSQTNTPNGKSRKV